MHSMTGFGRGEAGHDSILFQTELRSVNRKQLDIVVNSPRELSELESRIRNHVSKAFSRGRISTHLSYSTANTDESRKSITVDKALAAQYANAARDIADALGTDSTLEVSDLLRAPGVISIEERKLDPDTIWPAIQSALDQAIEAMTTMRASEGKNLQTDLLARVATIRNAATEIASLAPGVVTHHRNALHQRLAEADVDLPLDDERLVREIGLFAERCDISEELTRIESHCAQFETYLNSGEAVGRSLDFLSQELFREFNTIGSKANNATIAHHVVTGKTEIEKAREQVQNIE